MSYLTITGGILGFILFFPLCKSIINKTVTQNPLTFFLWALLDVIFAYAAYCEDGNYLQPTIFALGGFITVGCIVWSNGVMRWTWFESLITILAMLCIIIWQQTGNNVLAATASLVALIIASTPQIIETWENPKKTPTLIYVGYTLSSLLATLGGKEMSVVEVGYQFSGFLLSLMISLFSSEKVRAYQV